MGDVLKAENLPQGTDIFHCRIIARPCLDQIDEIRFMKPQLRSIHSHQVVLRAPATTDDDDGHLIDQLFNSIVGFE